ncbi:DUF4175 family protein [Chiayiivirga flava]|uniref:DUF4175 domain-containing protein n=1 Tax=Chiayiivirga flava TaxID=659595 RepID=A0A7W8D8F4_9GAMM|nr:DUF4175 family protein [Chiayiivirga flava]MBB5209785.1 hypothetical protein [Chiayiivirga flava]
MSAAVLQRLKRRAQWRRALVVALAWLPWIGVAVAIAWRLDGATGAAFAAAAGLAACALHAALRARAIDTAWLVAALDAAAPELQDSADLLFARTDALGPLQALQQTRVLHRLGMQPPDLREPLPWRPLRRTLPVAVIGVLVVLAWPRPHGEPAPIAATPAQPAAQVQSLQASLDIRPPAYTGLAARRLDAIDGEAEQGSTLAWTLRFAVAPQSVRLRFVDGDTLELTRDAGVWRGERMFERSALFRIETDGAPPLPNGPPYRIEIRPDLAPQIRVLQPERTLSVLDAATRRWQLVFEASDDHALGAATLELTLAQGSGEQVTVSERRIALRGEGDTRTRRYAHAVELAALGYAQGDDLIARVTVRDTRAPTPNVARSASFILRWPPPQGTDGTGVEGLVQTAMPAYFRSQRQIIIDTEALLAQRAQLDAATVLARSDAIGNDQRILRLRYGQFLGEESETDAPPPRHDDGDDHDDSHADDAHDHAPPANANADDLMRGAGHLHDLPEAATLLDPAARELLRAALNEMWQAEGALRGGHPDAALPFERRALEFIKRVQQADRIYLARVGLELPQLDPTRRLTGERDPLTARRDPLVPRAQTDDVPRAAWQALHDDAPLPLAELLDWLRGTPDAATDRLALLQHIDALQRDPACRACRDALARALWPSLVPPPAAPLSRPAPDAVGRAYLDALAPPAADEGTP